MFVSARGFCLSESNRVGPRLVLHGIQGLVLTLPLCMACAKGFRVSVWVYRCHLGDAFWTLMRLMGCADCIICTSKRTQT